MGDDCSHQACRSSCSRATGRCLKRNTIEKVEQAARSEVGFKFSPGGKTATSGRAWQISRLMTQQHQQQQQQQNLLTSLWWSPSAPWRISGRASCYGRARQSHCFFHPVEKLGEKKKINHQNNRPVVNNNHLLERLDSTVKALSSSALTVSMLLSCICSSFWSTMLIFAMCTDNSNAKTSLDPWRERKPALPPSVSVCVFA